MDKRGGPGGLAVAVLYGGGACRDPRGRECQRVGEKWPKPSGSGDRRPFSSSHAPGAASNRPMQVTCRSGQRWAAFLNRPFMRAGTANAIS